MKIQLKKIIAKEFLVLIAVIILGVIGFLCTYLYNQFKRAQITKVDFVIVEKQKIVDSLNKLENSLLPVDDPFIKYGGHELIPAEKFYNSLVNLGYTTEVLGTKSDFLINIQDTKFANKLYDKLTKAGFTEKNLGTKNEFLLAMKNVFYTKKLNFRNQLKDKQIELHKLKFQKEAIIYQLLTNEEQIKFGFIIFAFFSIILFGLRYLIYAVKWSVKTLKE